jgi:hypothetical protein
MAWTRPKLREICIGWRSTATCRASFNRGFPFISDFSIQSARKQTYVRGRLGGGQRAGTKQDTGGM